MCFCKQRNISRAPAAVAQQHCSGIYAALRRHLCLLQVRQQCCKLASFAARAAQASTRERQRAREQRSRASHGSSTRCRGLFTVKNCCPPPIFPKENGHDRPSPLKKIACGALKMPGFSGGRRCAARIGYPGGIYHPRHLQGVVAIPGIQHSKSNVKCK